MLKKKKQLKTCIYTYVGFESLTHVRTVACYVTDQSSRQGGRPMTSKTATILTTIEL